MPTKKKRKDFSYESLQDARSIVAYMQALADGLSEGSLVLASNGDELVLEPQGLLRFRVEAKRSSSRERLVLKVSWRSDQAPDEGAGALEINGPND